MEYCRDLEIKDVEEIPYERFARWENLKEVTIHEGIKSIGGFAFAYCQNLKSISFPKSLRGIS